MLAVGDLNFGEILRAQDTVFFAESEGQAERILEAVGRCAGAFCLTFHRTKFWELPSGGVAEVGFRNTPDVDPPQPTAFAKYLVCYLHAHGDMTKEVGPGLGDMYRVWQTVFCFGKSVPGAVDVGHM